jgi:hypothetical protein
VKGGRRPAALGKSRVVETRRKPCHITLRGKVARNVTVVRRRECLKCGYRWSTMEVIIYEKRKYTAAWGGPRTPKIYDSGCAGVTAND